MAWRGKVDEFFLIPASFLFFGLWFLFFVFCIFCKMEVDHPPSEIAPSNSTAANNVNNNGGTSKDVNHSGAFVLPYNPDLVEPNRVPSSGQRIKLQVEVNSDYKFLTICDPASTISLLFAPYFLAREYKVSSPHLLPSPCSPCCCFALSW